MGATPTCTLKFYLAFEGEFFDIINMPTYYTFYWFYQFSSVFGILFPSLKPIGEFVKY